MTMCPHYKDMVNKRDIDRSLEEKKILDKYQKWINIIDQECKGQEDEDGFLVQYLRIQNGIVYLK